MRYLTIEEILLIHEYELQKYGGTPGVSSLELLESAIFRPQTSFGGKELYKTLFEKSASLIYSIIKNHPFVDGNKRTAMVAGTVFLRLNNIKINLTQKRFEQLALNVAKNEISLKSLSGVLKDSSTELYNSIPKHDSA